MGRGRAVGEGRRIGKCKGREMRQKEGRSREEKTI